MSRLNDPEILARYKKALADWKIGGAILPKGQRVLDDLRTTLGDVDWKAFTAALYQFVVEEDGEIDQVKEKREPWREQWEYHYDLRPTINDQRYETLRRDAASSGIVHQSRRTSNFCRPHQTCMNWRIGRVCKKIARLSTIPLAMC